jgi:hypothetical protein
MGWVWMLCHWLGLAPIFPAISLTLSSLQVLMPFLLSNIILKHTSNSQIKMQNKIRYNIKLKFFIITTFIYISPILLCADHRTIMKFRATKSHINFKILYYPLP